MSKRNIYIDCGTLPTDKKKKKRKNRSCAVRADCHLQRSSALLFRIKCTVSKVWPFDNSCALYNYIKQVNLFFPPKLTVVRTSSTCAAAHLCHRGSRANSRVRHGTKTKFQVVVGSVGQVAPSHPTGRFGNIHRHVIDSQAGWGLSFPFS